MLKRLAEQFPSAVAQLRLQYRMHEDICYLCNEIVYQGKLQCANENVKNGKLSLMKYPSAILAMRSRLHSVVGGGWLLPVLNPHRTVVFADTDAVRIQPTSTDHCWLEMSRKEGCNEGGGNMVNESEARLTRTVVQGLLACGLDPASIGVISPYRSQVSRFDYIYAITLLSYPSQDDAF